MKRFLILACILIMILPVKAKAAELSVFDGEISGIEGAVPYDTSEVLSDMRMGSVEELIHNGVDLSVLLIHTGDLLQTYLNTPLSVMLMIIAVIILAGVAESYSHTLRYTDTRDIMGVAVSLYIATVFISPVSSLIDSSVKVIQGASAVMTAYLLVMAGILLFSGRAITSAGYYAASAAAAQFIGRVSATLLSPLLKLFLSLSVSAGICPRMRLNGLIEMTSKGFKWLLTFSMAIFTAVIGLNTALAKTGDTVAGRAAGFTLTSLVPIIGSSIAEAYKTIQGSLGLLRSGAGVFVILSVAISFAPVIIRAVLWSAALYIAKLVQDALSVNSTARILSALSSFMAALRAMLTAVMTAFIISSAALMSIGGTA